ncbi:MAG: CBS domain-containing protein [Gammaproteobacteria bacterium]|jgi:CBS domain-containing protein|nr:CBS domain-containing protein [Gammaproteobacteria bacterium]MBT3488205.1 CBS domain-containing protein [Gammaproteobacteria bacterium]MBT3719028.1 CBS domain-containing protein [Gammaproteobacteria bacterium]MBT3843882.1 CBS domain-containing protein [Gammaproteobacteria bacterium]MBT3892444.1 CBS domain-containing protein [Gammaproteobacteria bacterium]
MDDNKVIRVRDVMKTKFDLVDGLATVSEALAEMRHVENKSLIVDKRHEDDEFGMLLISDIARQVLAKDRSPDRVNVYEVMSKPVITVDTEMDIRYCARLFERFNLSRSPVTKGSKVVGIVSFTDMVLKGMCDYN